MRATTVSLGILGVRQEQLPTIADAMIRQRRFNLTDLYDPCLAAAERLSGQYATAYSPSLRRMLQRVEGLAVLNCDWQGDFPLLAAAQAQRPVLILRPALARFSHEQLLRLRDEFLAASTFLMPELAPRWFRSTLRLRELTATRLGAIESLRVTCRAAGDPLALLEVIDYCREIVQSDFRSVTALADREQLLLTFRRMNKQDEPVAAEIRIERFAGFPGLELRTEATCRHGVATLNGESQLEWSAGRLQEKELLQVERTSLDVMFDLFGRRLVGGVVPVPDLNDLLRASQVSAAFSLSRARGEPVEIPAADPLPRTNS